MQDRPRSQVRSLDRARHLPILIIVVSLVYAGTRYDDWPNIFKEARRWVVRLVGFLGAVVLVLYVLALLTP